MPANQPVLDSVVKQIAGDIAAETGRSTRSILIEWRDEQDTLRRYQHLIRMTYRDRIAPQRARDRPLSGLSRWRKS